MTTISRNKGKGKRSALELNPNTRINKDDSYGRVSALLMRSKAYGELTKPARELYVILLAHAWTPESKRCIYKRATSEGLAYDHYPADSFVFPPKHQILYGYNSKSMVKKYMDELIRAGFIQKFEYSHEAYKMIVYIFSDEWKKNGGSQYKVIEVKKDE